MALTVSLAGDLNIQQGESTTLTATVTDADSNAVEGATVAFSAAQGSFSTASVVTDASGEAATVWTADFSDPNNVDVVITATATLPANPNPTVSGPSLTAMTALGITGQILNMYIDDTEATANGGNTVLYAEGSSDSSLASGSDDDISSTLHIWRVQWNAGSNWFILNDNGTGTFGAYFSNNTTQSIYLVFSDGTYYEITQAMYDNGGDDWARWDTTSNAALTTKLDNLGANDTLLVGVGTADTIGFPADSGANTATVTARAQTGTGTITTTHGSIYEGQSVNFTLQFAEDVTGLLSSEVNVTGGTLNSLTASGTDAYILNITAAAGAGSIVITIPAGSTVPANVEVTATFSRLALTTPGAPSLSVAPDSTSAAVTVTPTTDNGGSAITGNQYRYAQGTTIPTNTAWNNFTGTSFTISGLTRATQYAVEARHINTQGNGTPSEVVTFTTDAVVPVAATDFRISHITDTTALGSWMGGDDGGEPITGHQYQIQAGTTPGGAWVNTDSTLETHTITGLMPSTEYTARVRRVNSVGASDPSNPVTFTTQTQITISADVARIGNGASATLTLTLSAADDLDSADIDVTAGTKGAFTVVDTQTYTLVVIAPAAGAGTIHITVSEDAVASGNPAATFTLNYGFHVDVLSIESIDEQFIPINTEDYSLEIGIGGDPDDVVVGGLQEGFYQDWDAANDRVFIKAEVVTRLIAAAIWTIQIEKSGTSVDATIIYNVVPVAPVIADPGEQQMYKGFPFSTAINIANAPTLVRGSGPLVALKSEPATDEDGNQMILSAGRLPDDARLTFDTFNETYYAENEGGFDELDVAFTIIEFSSVAPLVAALNANSKLIKVFDTSNNNAQVGSDIAFGTSGFLLDIAMSGTRVAAIASGLGVYLIKVFDTSNNNAQVGSDIALGAGNWTDLAMSINLVAGLDNTNNRIKVFDTGNNNAQVGSDIALGAGNWTDLAMSATFIAAIALASANSYIKVFNTSNNNMQVGSDIALGTGNWADLAMSGPLVAVISNANSLIKVFDTGNNNAQVGSDIALGTGNWRDITISRTFVAGLDNTNNLIKVFNTSNNNMQVGSDMALGTGIWDEIAMSGPLVAAISRSSRIKVFDIRNGMQVGGDIAATGITQIAMST